MTRRTKAAAAALATVLLAAGCSTQSANDGVIDYWLWDSAQQPGYQRCADQFEAENPGLKVKISQFAWNDYWSKLTAGFIADQAPDVFTNHLSKYPQFVDLEVLVPLDSLEATKSLKDDEFAEGLADLWKGEDGTRYGAPKDWDTIGYFYDKKVLAKAGITEQQLWQADWNPDDGGTFEKIIAHLTVDKNGVRGDEPGFDKTKVAVYGLASEGAGGNVLGQTQWGAYTGSLPWEPLDKNPWGRQFKLDDPGFQKTIDWYFGLVKKGYMPGYEAFNRQSGSYQQVSAGQAVLGMNGSWMIQSFADIEGIDLGIAPTPIGPSGKRSSPFNGLADSVTTFADDKEAAGKWVAFMASDTCQDIIGDAGVVFPARSSGIEKSLAKRKAAGIDTSAFTIHIEEGTTQMLAVTTNAADVSAITVPAFEAVYIGQEPASSLTGVNNQVNRLMTLTEQ